MTQLSDNKDRNIGIDLLRLLSMYMVVILHILGHGGVLRAIEGEVPKSVLLLLYSFCTCAVDCFAIITGYVSFGKKQSVEQYLKTWVIVAFYSIIISLIFFVRGNIGKGTLLFSILPLATHQYWYFTSYSLAYLFLPMMNKYCAESSRKKVKTLAYLMLLLTIAYGTFSRYMFGNDLFCFENGYSACWLAVLFFIGLCIKKGEDFVCPPRNTVLILFVAPISYWLACLIGSTYLNEILESYVNPLTVIYAISLVKVFSMLRVTKYCKRAISFLTPSAFAVYLIHDNKLIRSYIMKDNFICLISGNCILTLLRVLFFSLLIFTGCICFDVFIRRLAFKVLNVNSLISKVVAYIDRL